MDAEVSPFKDDYWLSRGSSTGPALKGNLEPKATQRFMRNRGAYGAMWNYDYDYTQQGPWYRCVCDTPGYDINNIGSKNARHNVNRSLKRCVVRRIDYGWLGDNGYEVYINATSRYANFKPDSREQFKLRMNHHADNANAEAFGVFVGEKLAAYMTLFLGGQSVRGDYAHFDPAYSRAYPMYALYYTVPNYYLNERGFREFDRGTRPLLHETNIDEFLLRLGYRKSYCRLGLHLVWHVRVVLRMARILKRMCKLILPGRYYAILEGLLLAQDIANATKKQKD